jgi:hypothetical protein
MNRHFFALVAATLFCSFSGCLFVNHSTKVVRDKEPMQRVAFESEQARQSFMAGVHDLQSHKQSYNFQVSAMPLLWWRSSANELSDNAIYNDQISVCDTNGDGFISTQEAVTYRSIVAAQISEAEKNKLRASQPQTSTATTYGQPAPGVPQTTPPGLIHSATRVSD